MQFSLQLVSQRSKKEFIASCLRHVTRCSVFRKHVTVSSWYLQWFQKISAIVEESRTELHSNFLCNLCGNGVARQVSGRLQCIQCPLCNLSRNFMDLQWQHKVKLGSIFIGSTLVQVHLNCVGLTRSLYHLETVQFQTGSLSQVYPFGTR